ncbi:MAG: DnaD domain protein [Dehalococcoidia bacterium]|nr:MAG: DnaD domain protein [Dehalococcoidia bacterium]
MPRKRWIKLWTQETLYGTTSAELELDEQAIWFKLLALAGDSPEPGKIEVAPSIPMTDEQIAGVVKAPLSVWLRTKQRLQAPDVDKISVNQGIIHITNWEKYQAEADRTEYMRQYMRDYRKGKTTGKPNSKQANSKQANSKPTDQTRGEGRGGEQSTITTATTSENLAKISKLFEDNIGRLTSVIGERLKDIADKYPAGWFEEALKEAVELEHRNLKYIEAILERWRTDGYKAPKKREFEKRGERHGGTGENRQHPKFAFDIIESGEDKVDS